MNQLSGTLKALSLKQPIAWLIANGYMLVDDRSWGTGYRGPVLIHASKGAYAEYHDFLRTHTDIPVPPLEELEYGGIVGIANLVHCGQQGSLPAGVTDLQRTHFGRLQGECYGFLFEDARPLTLIPCPGKLGMFDIDLDAVRAAPRQIGLGF